MAKRVQDRYARAAPAEAFENLSIGWTQSRFIARLVIGSLALLFGAPFTSSASADIYWTHFCRTSFPAESFPELEKRAAAKLDELTSVSREGVATYQTQAGFDFGTGQDLWLVVAPWGAVASCSNWHSSTLSVEAPAPLWMDTGRTVSDSRSTTHDLEMSVVAFNEVTGCGTACGFDSVTVVIHDDGTVYELFVSPIDTEHWLNSRSCPLAFSFSIERIEIDDGLIGVTGTIAGILTCTWQGRACSISLPKTEATSHTRRNDDGIYRFDVTELREFKYLVELQDDLLKDAEFSVDEGATKRRFERCVSARSSRS